MLHGSEGSDPWPARQVGPGRSGVGGAAQSAPTLKGQQCSRTEENVVCLLFAEEADSDPEDAGSGRPHGSHIPLAVGAGQQW